MCNKIYIFIGIKNILKYLESINKLEYLVKSINNIYKLRE